MENWFTELHTKDTGISIKVAKPIYTKFSKYQRIDIFQNKTLGRILTLDGLIQLTESDEFIYHEMLVHPSLVVHPTCEEVLVVGGGDGGTTREALKHNQCRIDLVEIDEAVMKACIKFFPTLSLSLSDERVKLFTEDGTKFTKKKKSKYDVIIVDSTDPIGFAKELFRAQFYKSCYSALKENGILVAQSESPILHRGIMKGMYKNLSAIFPIVQFYLVPIPTYPSGLWSFVFCSKKYQPLEFAREVNFTTKYYNLEIHKASFALPNFVKDIFNSD